MRSAAAFVLCVVALVAGTAAGQGAAGGTRPDCVVANPASALGAFGNNLSVHVENRCTYEVTCRVSADVNPQISEVRIAAGASTDVGVFRESPAREFAARVDCPLREPAPRGRRE